MNQFPYISVHAVIKESISFEVPLQRQFVFLAQSCIEPQTTMVADIYRTVAISPTTMRQNGAVRKRAVRQNFTVTISHVLLHCGYLTRFVIVSIAFQTVHPHFPTR